MHYNLLSLTITYHVIFKPLLSNLMFIKVNKSFNKLLIMHFAGTGSKAGTMLIKGEIRCKMDLGYV